MNSIKWYAQRKKITVMAFLVLFLMTLASPAMALNYNGTGGGGGGGGGGTGDGNKSLNFYGYEYIDSTHVTLYFDKNIGSGSLPTEYFSISGGRSVTAATATSGNNTSGVTGTGLNNGGNVALTFDSALSADTSYDLTILNTFASNSGLSLGNYNNKQDFTFAFKTPNGLGNYTGTPAVSFWPSITSNVPYEGNIGFIVDRPVAAGDVSSVLSGMNTNFERGGTAVTLDSSIDGTAVSGAEAYTAKANNARNTFFFPLVASTNNFTVYNLVYSSGSQSYTMDVPSFTDVSSNSYSGTTHSFSTVGDDIAGWLNNTPTAAATGFDEITVEWDETTITADYPPVLPDDYRVYVSTTDPYTGFIDDTANASISESSGHYTAVFSGLLTGTSYWYRIVPSLSGREAGFSLVSDQVDL